MLNQFHQVEVVLAYHVEFANCSCFQHQLKRIQDCMRRTDMARNSVVQSSMQAGLLVPEAAFEGANAIEKFSLVCTPIGPQD